jgi:hypothetical protein
LFLCAIGAEVFRLIPLFSLLPLGWFQLQANRIFDVMGVREHIDRLDFGDDIFLFQQSQITGL